MARVTIEDCLENIDDRFELVLLSAQRTRELLSGVTPLVEIRNDKEEVIALREIGEKHININHLKKNLLYKINKTTFEEDFEEDTSTQKNNKKLLEETINKGQIVTNHHA